MHIKFFFVGITIRGFFCICIIFVTWAYWTYHNISLGVLGIPYI
jgi:hypothetical protein